MAQLTTVLLAFLLLVAANAQQTVDSITRVQALQTTLSSKFTSGIIDVSRDAAYFASKANSQITKVQLSSFSEVGVLNLAGNIPSLDGPSAPIFDSVNNVAFFASSYQQQAFKMNLQTMTIMDTCELAYGFTSVDVGLLDPVHDVLYFVGNQAANCYLIKIPYVNFTSATTGTELPNLRFDTTEKNVVTAGCIDVANQIGYFATGGDTSTLFQVNLENMTLVSSFVIASGVGHVSGALCNLDRKLIYFYTSTSPSYLIKFDLSNVANVYQLNYSSSDTFTVLTLSTVNRAVQAGDIDRVGGQAYLGTYSSPGRAVHVDLGVLGEVDSIRMNDGEDSMAVVLLDADNRVAYYGSGTADPGVIIKVALPPACPNDCFGRGWCNYSYCVCDKDPLWEGRSCNLLKCPDNCGGSDHGVCNNGTCICTPYWKGVNCSIRTCANECSFRGYCNVTNNYTCECPSNWAGADCSEIPPIPPCDQLFSCDKCFANSSCGWCDDEGTCFELANRDSPEIGPAGTGCYSWHYDTCPVVGLQVLAWILTAVAGLMLLVNFVSAMHEDLTTPAGRPTDVQIRRSWWRNQRSAKAWYLIDRMQFTAITCMFSVQYHTVYMTFCNIFKWTLLGYRLPWSIFDLDHPTYSQRMLLSFKQWGTWMKGFQEEIYLGHLFWFAIILGGAAVGALIANVIATIVQSENFKNMAKNRSIYVGLRLLLFGYWSITVTAWYHVTLDMEDDGERKAALVIAIFTLAVFSVGLPVYIFFGLFGKKKELFNKTFRQRYGCLYNSFYFKKSFYLAVLLAKKFIVGLFVGTLNDHEVPLLVVLIIIYIAYLIQLILAKPYLDHVHFFMDIAVTGIDIVILLFMFVFLNSVDDYTAKLAIAVILVVLHIVAMVIVIAAFVNSWFKLKNIHTFKQFVKALQGKHDDSGNAGTQMNTISKR